MSHCDCTSPSAYREVTRKARKAHRCAECGYAINPGDRYSYTSGVWDGNPDSFKRCLACMTWSDALVAAIRERRLDVCDCWPIGCLGDALGDYQAGLAERERQQERERRWRENGTFVQEAT